MNKKTGVQIFLIFILFLSSIYILKIIYFDKKKNNSSLVKFDQKKDHKSLSSLNKQNLIENIRYKSNNFKGDTFEILADFGETSLENTNLMFLTNVKANLIFQSNNDSVILVSDFANFNTQTFETTFYDNVEITRKDEIISGEKLYFVMDLKENKTKTNIKKDENILRMTENIVYKKAGYNLKADFIEIDLITKSSIIRMINKKNRVIINNLSN